jgi:hypothetical protein
VIQGIARNEYTAIGSNMNEHVGNERVEREIGNKRVHGGYGFDEKIVAGENFWILHHRISFR